ncbi:thioredoxin [Sedimentibacter sp. zth1]|uniref:thioredoxin n=1 Tax=Sedimentibacter sp. zth1 TaxID=2816908 RepID=UPI001A9104A8|nr:thioredoxin [Sedimentibacter sp. zth1]QSX05732.1 thioredoxin [Sedimentibacter sp. zth1]
MKTITINKQNFEQEILNSKKQVLIDFWASWCNPCKMLSPTVDEIASEQDNVKVCKINIDEHPELAKKFFVMSIPTLVLVEKGKEINRSVGLVPKHSILEMMS